VDGFCHPKLTNPRNDVVVLIPEPVAAVVPRPAPWERGPLGFVRKHPVLFLALLTPGIPEYLSGSSPVAALLTNPLQFVFQLVLNLGLYCPGVLLIREAAVRWHKGWPSILLMGAAYGILEEGIALSTLFNPASQVVVSSNLGQYGHWLGVNWIWLEGILLVHMIFSVSIPILLLGLAVPGLRGVSLLNDKRVTVVSAVLGVDVLVLSLLIYYGQHFWMGTPVFVGGVLSMLGLTYLARRAPADLPSRKVVAPKFGLKTTAVAGCLVYPGILFVEVLTRKTVAPLTFVLVLFFEAGCLWWVLNHLNFPHNERHLVAFVLGLTVPIMLFGVVSQFPLDLVLVLDLALFLLFSNLLKMYPATTLVSRST